MTEFDQSVRKSENGCWLWQGLLDHHGFGRFTSAENGNRIGKGSKVVAAHRYSLSRYLGRPIEPGYVVKQECGNHACVRPSHLSEIPVVEMNGLDEIKVIEIRELVAARNPIRQVAEKYGIHATRVSRIARGEVYAEFGGPITRKEDRGTHCRNGHKRTPDNTGAEDRCLDCTSAQQTVRREARKAARKAQGLCRKGHKREPDGLCLTCWDIRYRADRIKRGLSPTA